jgi:hypothetical protein
MRCAPLTTCAFVMMYPLESTTNPLPIALCLPITSPVFPCPLSSTVPKPVTRICTTLGDTLLMSASTDSFTLRNSSVARSCPDVAFAHASHTTAVRTAQPDFRREPAEITFWAMGRNMEGLSFRRSANGDSIVSHSKGTRRKRPRRGFIGTPALVRAKDGLGASLYSPILQYEKLPTWDAVNGGPVTRLIFH